MTLQRWSRRAIAKRRIDGRLPGSGKAVITVPKRPLASREKRCYPATVTNRLNWNISLLNGLYKVEYGIGGAFGRSIMCMHDGKMLGGNSAFAHLGSYEIKDGVIEAEVITERHNDDPYYKPLMGAEVTAIQVRGRTEGSTILFEGKADPMPDSVFWANLTPLDDEALPPRGTVGPGGIVNGLYSIHIRALDGVDAALTGVALLMDGRILDQEHTPAKGENPIFGGHEVGIGFSGTCSEAGAELEGIALAGKRSLRLAATLKLMRQA